MGIHSLGPLISSGSLISTLFWQSNEKELAVHTSKELDDGVENGSNFTLLAEQAVVATVLWQHTQTEIVGLVSFWTYSQSD